MAQIRTLDILTLAHNDNTKYIWRHLWNTSQEIINEKFKDKRISISTEYTSGTLVASIKMYSMNTAYVLIKKVFDELSNQTKAVKRKVCHKITEDELNRLSEQLRNFEIGCYPDQERNWVWFVGSAVIIDNIHNYLENIDCKFLQEDPIQKNPTDETESSLEDSFEHVSVPMLLSQDDQAIIWLHDLLKWDCLSSSNVHVECHRFNIKILAIDPKEKEDIEKKIKAKIDDFRQMLACQKLSFNPSTLEFILRPAVHDFLLSRVNTKCDGFDVAWFEDQGNVVKLYTSDDRKVNSKSTRFKECIKEEGFPVPSVVFKRSKTIKQLEQIESDFNGKVCIKLSSTAATVNVIYTSDSFDVVKKIHALYATSPVYLYKENQSKCRMFFTKIKHLIEKKHEVDLSEDESYGDYAWVVKGEHDKTQMVHDQLKKLQESITSETKSCITDENNDILLEKVQTIDETSRCLIKIKDISPSSMTRKTFNIDIRDKVQYRTWTLKCGTIVKLNNCDMRQMLWMLNGSFVVDILEAPAQEENPKINTNHLKDFSVATIYLRKWQENRNQERNILCSQMNTLLKEIAEHPHIMALNFDLADIDKVKWPVQKYIKEILAVVKTMRPTITVLFNDIQKARFDRVTEIIDDVNAGSKIDSGGTKTGLKITVIKGELAKQKADVIVNSANKTLQLGSGAVSSSILKHAGQGIQDDCNSQLLQLKKTEIAYTQVVMTEAYNLGCGIVFHGTLPTYAQDNHQVLEKFIRNCLMKAETHQVKSIAFPALGTGNLGYPPEFVAEKMFHTVEKFAKEIVPKKLSEVCFVIYPTDDNAIKAFEREEVKRRRPDVKWTEFTAMSPLCVTCKISVVGENSRIVQDTFKEVIESISKKKRENIMFSRSQSSVESHDTSSTVPFDQTIDRRANISSTEQPENLNPQVSDKGSNGQEDKKIPTDSIHMSHNTFAPDEDLPRFTDKPEGGVCTVEIMIIEDDVEDPCKEILDVMNRLNIKEEKIVWNELNCKQARVKLSSETDADHLISCLADKRRYKIMKCSPDAVVNIRAKLSQSMRTFLQMEKIRSRLIKYSGVGIDNDKGEVILRGDLTEISTARDLLIRWKEEGCSQTNTEIQITKLSKSPLALEELGCMESDPLNRSNVQSRNENNQLASKTKSGKDIHQAMINKSLDEENSSNESNFDRPFNGNKNYTDEHGSTKRLLQDRSPNDAMNEYAAEGERTRNPEVVNPSSNALDSKPSDKNIVPTRKQFENLGGDDKYEIPPLTVEKQHINKDVRRPNINKPESGEMNNRNKGKEHNKDPWEKKVMEPLHIPQDESLMLITKEGIKVFVYKAKICHIANVDCIVNSTNSDMTHKFGLSQVIAEAAGKSMMEECKQFISSFAILGRSDIFVSTAGNLSHYRKILHIHAPKMKEDMNISDFSDDLSNTVRMCLSEASKKRLKSVALPAISSGYGGAPKDHRFLAYPNGVLEFSRKEGKTTTVREVHFVDVGDEVVNYMQAAFLHAHPDSSHSNIKDKIKKLSEKAKEFYKAIKSAPAGNHSEFYFYKLAVVTCDGGLLSTWKHPHIRNIQQSQDFGVWEDNETAVVMTEDQGMNGKSASSQKCQERGGRSFKQNYDGLKNMKRAGGKVFDILGDDNLNFGFVLVTIMPHMSRQVMKRNSNEQNGFFRLLSQCCKNVLSIADKNKVKHLSMPVLGADSFTCKDTWFLEACVSCVFTEVDAFKEKRKGENCMVVHIVTNGNVKLLQILEQHIWMIKHSSRV